LKGCWCTVEGSESPGFEPQDISVYGEDMAGELKEGGRWVLDTWGGIENIPGLKRG